MRQRQLLLLPVLLASCITSASANAATILSMDGHGVARATADPYLPPSDPAAPAPALAKAVAAGSASRPTVSSALARLRAGHQISAAMFSSASSEVHRAVALATRLGGDRGAELNGVLDNLRTVAADRELSASRLPALLLTLRRNREWWGTGPLLSDGQRVEFRGSQLVWEHYPGQGIELQELGSFGKANGLYTGHAYAAMRRLLGELIPLASARAGGIAWEYFFAFEAGTPPWTSAMSQATAIQALSRAYRTTRNPRYLTLARAALPVLRTAPPQGVSVPTPQGRRYLLYSFAPGEAVINGFLQTLIGLRELAVSARMPEAQRLFDQGDREARAELPAYDTGSWSLYQPGQESTLSYHQLVTGFLDTLCSATHVRRYCATAARFTAYLHAPPALTLLTPHLPAGVPSQLRFRLSKISHVGIVLTRGARTLLLTSASFPHGVGAFSLPALRRGGYTVRLAATDLAGNFHRIAAPLRAGG